MLPMYERLGGAQAPVGESDLRLEVQAQLPL
jgi:hypothetical protein